MERDHDREVSGRVVDAAPSGRLMRRRVHDYLEASVLPKGGEGSVLEIGSQGENAAFLGRSGHHVIATHSDASCLERARSVARSAGVDDRVVFRTLDIRSDRPTGFDGAFDLVLGDFGALNTLEPNEVRILAVAVTTWVRDGGRAVFLVMPRVCAWEVVSNAVRGRWRRIGSRSPSAVATPDGGLHSPKTWYHDPAKVADSFSPSFEVRHLEPLGLALPPFGSVNPVAGSPPVLTVLSAVERVGRAVPGLSRFSDHYLVDLQRSTAIVEPRHAAQVAPRQPRLATEPMGNVATRRRAV